MNALGCTSPNATRLYSSTFFPDNVDDSLIAPCVGGKVYPSRAFYTGQVRSFFMSQGKGSKITRVKGSSKKVRVHCDGCNAGVEATFIKKTREWKVVKVEDLDHPNCIKSSAPILKVPQLSENFGLMTAARMCSIARGAGGGAKGLITYASTNMNGLILTRDQAYNLMSIAKSSSRDIIDDQYSLFKPLLLKLEALNHHIGCRMLFKADDNDMFEYAGILLPGAVEYVRHASNINGAIDAGKYFKSVV